MKKICVFSAGRSDYFLLKPLIKRISFCKELDLKLVLGSMHTDKKFGSTHKNVKADGFDIDFSVNNLSSKDTNEKVVRCLSKDLASYSKYLPKIKPDIAIVLGDRYETLSFVIACHFLRIPIVHIHGGELSYGSFDDATRHAITKFSYLHFPSSSKYRKRIIQMGEPPKNVKNFGSLAVESIKKIKKISLKEISSKLKINLNKNYFLVTVHPETSKKTNNINEISSLIDVLEGFREFDIIWTGSNADPGGLLINKYLSKVKNIFRIENLGEMYLPVMKCSKGVIGNSSSGIIEAPIMGIPTVNIGSRQDGRIRCNSIFDCSFDKDLINKNIMKCLNTQTRFSHPYGSGDTSKKIFQSLIKFSFNDGKKEFYDKN